MNPDHAQRGSRSNRQSVAASASTRCSEWTRTPGLPVGSAVLSFGEGPSRGGRRVSAGGLPCRNLLDEPETRGAQSTTDCSREPHRIIDPTATPRSVLGMDRAHRSFARPAMGTRAGDGDTMTRCARSARDGLSSWACSSPDCIELGAGQGGRGRRRARRRPSRPGRPGRAPRGARRGRDRGASVRSRRTRRLALPETLTSRTPPTSVARPCGGARGDARGEHRRDRARPRPRTTPAASRRAAEVRCWGYNTEGTSSGWAPIAEPRRRARDRHRRRAADGPVRAIAAGGYQTCALTAGRPVWCWGSKPRGAGAGNG